ncbi:MAG: 3-hydroxyacyl-CoA dehydrogenase type-2 [Pseudomonadota bacterium]
MNIQGKSIIVTGAGSGLGAATAQWLSDHGAQITIADLKAPETMPAGAIFARTDVTSPEDAAGAISAAKSSFGAVHGLVNCAGIAPSERIVGRSGAHDLQNFARTININLIGSFNMLRLAAEAMQANDADENGERGVIVNTASVAAFDGQIGQAGYAASKGGIASLTLPAARELARAGIRVLAIAPGIFETPMMAAMPQAVQDSLGATVPFPARLGRPSEYAALVGHIFSNTYLNGEVIRLDGALRMAAK